MNKKAKDIIGYLCSTLFAALLLYFSFKDVKWQDFWQGLKSCAWEYIIVSMVASVAAFWLRALRWRELILPADPSIDRVTAFNAINIGYIVNIVLPRVGEFVRCLFITRHSEQDEHGHKKASYDKVLGTAVVDRVWDVLVMLLLLVFLLVFMWKRYGEFFRTQVFSSVGSNLGFLGILVPVIAVIVLVGYLIYRFRATNPFCAKIYSVMKGMGEGIATCMHMKSAWKFCVYTVLIWVMYWLMSYTVLLAVQGIGPAGGTALMGETADILMNLTWVDAIFLMIAGALSSLVPVPGGFGAFHYAVALALSTVYGIPFEIGIIFATLSHESQVITEILFGGMSYIHEQLRTIK